MRARASQVHLPGDLAEFLADETVLARRAVARDVGAAEIIFERHAVAVLRFVQRSLGPDHEAGDTTQDIFLEFFAALPRLRELHSLRSFLFAVAANTIRQELRRKRLRQVFLTDSGRMPDGAGPHPMPELQIAARRLCAALDRLRLRDREAFVLHHLEGFALPEVAAITETSLATVKRRIAHAQERLQRLVERDAELRGYLAAVVSDTPP